MTTPFLLNLDPTGEHHRKLGFLAAEKMLTMCPDGYVTEDAIAVIDRDIIGAVVAILKKYDASQEDMQAAVQWASDFFAERYEELINQVHRQAGHA